MEEDDADVASFFYYMRLAVDQIAPRSRTPLPLLTLENLPGLPAFTRRYFQDLYTRLRLPFVMVFDNYQDVPTDSPLHDVIREGLTQVPKGGNVIVISRSDPPSTLARLRASHAMRVIDWETLRLTPEEAHGIARVRGPGRRPRTTVELLHSRTDGWAAGLILMLEWAKAGDTATQPLEIHTPESIFDYFASEIFKKVDRRTQEFFLKTAFFGSMTPRMADQLAGPGRAKRILSELTRGNYFIEVHPLPQPVYRYHPLFREFLMTRAREAFSPADLAVVQRKAATILYAVGEIEEAFHLLHAANDWGQIVHLILKQAPTLLAQGRMRTLEGWLERVPQTMVDRTPWLQYWLGTCRLPFNLAQSRQHFEQAFEGFKVQRDPAGTFLSWFGIVETILAEWGDFTRLDRWIGILEVLVREYPSFPTPDIESRVASTMFCALLLRQPQHPDIELWTARAHTVALRSSDVHLRILTGFHLSTYYLWVGDLAKAAALAVPIREVVQSQEVAQHTRLMWAVADACLEWHIASHESCLKIVSEGLEMASKSGIRMWDYQLLGQGVYGAMVAGDLVGARGFLQKMASALEGSRHLDASHYHFLTAWKALLRKNIPLAFHHVQESLRLAIECGTPFPQGLNHLAMAQVLHEQGDHELAAGHLAKGRSIGRQMKSAMLEYMSLLAEAHFAMEDANEALSLKALREALALGNARGLVHTPWWRPAVMARLCVKALSAGIEVDYVQALIRKRGLVPESPPIDLEAWPWLLKVYTLGRFSLVREGQPVQFSGKAQHKPLAMLKALIALGGREVHEDLLADALWPGVEGDIAHQAFATTLHRLRILLGQENAVLLREKRATLNPRLCWVDTWAFERLLGRAETANKHGRSHEAVNLIERAFGLYKGPFLQGETTAAWAISPRERLRSKYLRHVTTLGKHWEQAGDLRRALDWYKKGLEVDDLAEEFYQRLISCYERLGRRAEALAVYQRCRRTLTALGATPSPETESLCRLLRHG